MRKLIKQQLQEETGLLEQANSILKNPGEDVSSEQLLELLTQEQELAISIGGRIEETEGAGTQAVALLEEYCEVLWHLSQELTQEKDCGDSWQNRLGKLQELVDQIKVQIDELPRQYDVVFLPYKASMWDSLESVWMAADQDPDCTCYVIPIPYCDLNQDGSVGQVHYEASLMPSYVPVTHYEAYDIKKNRPDIIYIHNPYDNTNMVTRVAAEFYSEELKKHTDMLVYIPYYLGTQHLTEEHKLLSAYLHADKIILQNETMVEDVHSAIPREKLAALGSPKADRILRLEKEKNRVIGQIVPKAWKKKMKGKKVVLYNVSISGILQFSEQALDKIRYVLSKFENREDVVLLWRPHPLIESTLKSMRPALYEEYMQIKRKFIADDYGILDETPDVGVSVVAADAYVGEDSSSLVNYFGVLGKPVLFTDWKVTEEWTEDERAMFSFWDCYFDKECAWFVPGTDLECPYLCKMDLKYGEVSLIDRLPGQTEKAAGRSAYMGIAKVDETVILAPYTADNIYIYRLNTKQAIKIPLKWPVDFNLVKIHVYKGRIFLAPQNFSSIVEINVQNGHCIYYEIPKCKDVETDSEILYGTGSAIYKNKLYVPRINSREIVVFNMDTGEFSEKKAGEGKGGYHYITIAKDEAWIVSDCSAEIVCWNLINEAVKVWDSFPNGFIGGEHPFNRVLECGDDLIAIPRTANMAVKILEGSAYVTKFVIQNCYQEGERQTPFYAKHSSTTNYTMAANFKEGFIALSAYNNSVIRYDISGNSAIFPCRFKKEDVKRLENEKINMIFQGGGIPNHCAEGGRLSISAFLDYLVTDQYQYHKQSSKKFQRIVNNLTKECGMCIHEYIMNFCRH